MDEVFSGFTNYQSQTLELFVADNYMNVCVVM